MSKDKLTDMSIDPNTIKGGKGAEKEIEVTDAKGKKSFKTVKVRKDPKCYISHHHGQGRTRNAVCVKKGEEILKVPRKGVETDYIAQGWSYCPRKEWKAKVRDAINK